jgi:FSR family fosmidomycin resistance protein-like MFS transporter
VSHFFQIVLPPIFPLLKDAFGVSYVELGIVMSLMYATSGLMQTSAGLIVDRFGPSRVLIGGLGLYSVAVLLYGFAPNLWVLAALAVAAGLGNCVFHPADYAILSARVEATRLGRAYGVHNFGGSLGWAAAPTAVLTLTALFGWRVALSILGGLGLLLTFCLVVQAAALSAKGRANRPGEAAASSAKVFLSQPILVCFGYFVLLAVATVALQAFLPSSLVSGFGISFALANSALTGFLVGSAVGMFVGGIIVDYFGRQELVVAIGLLTTALVSLSIGILAVPIPALILVIYCHRRVRMGLHDPVARYARARRGPRWSHGCGRRLRLFGPRSRLGGDAPLARVPPRPPPSAPHLPPYRRRIVLGDRHSLYRPPKRYRAAKLAPTGGFRVGRSRHRRLAQWGSARHRPSPALIPPR